VQPDNWSLRLPTDFEQLYYTRVAKGAALNIPLSLARALEACGLSADAAGAQLATELRRLAADLASGATLTIDLSAC
jgi:hypothetical protein